MRSKSIVRLSILVIAASVLLTAALMPSTVLAQATSDAIVFATQSLHATQVGTYWTADRLRIARPLPLPTLVGSTTDTQGTAAPSGQVIIANSGGPGDTPTQETLGHTVEGTTEPLYGTSPFIYTRYRLFPDNGLLGRLQILYKQFPSNLIGKLFFTIPGQGDFVCSGASVNSTNRSVVWTTGHCVYTPGIGPHTNFLFAPARRDRVNPYGTWTAKTVVTTNGWVNSGLREFDLGALVMNLGGAGNLKIGEAVGFLGFIVNVSRQQHWHIHGYPASPRDLNSTPPGAQFDGEHHEICAASWAADDQPSGNAANPKAIGVGCDHTGGASGGPFIVDFSGVGGQNNFVNGQATYRYTGPNPPEHLKIFSPYFGDAAANVRDEAQNIPVP